MDLGKALELFGYTSIDSIDQEEFKKRYRNIAKKNHPDAGGNTEIASKINEANDVIKRALKTLEEFKKMMQATRPQAITSIIPVSALHKLYSGGSITLGSGDNKVELTDRNLWMHNIYVVIEFDITYENITKHIEKYVPVDLMRKYEVDCEIDVTTMDTMNIQLQIYSQTRNFDMTYNQINVPIKLENDIRVTVKINRKLI